MALLTKRTPALLVPVQAGVEPPFGYIRDFYSELKANPAVVAMYDFHADFCTLDGSNGITRVADSLGKSAPLTLVSGATPAVLMDDGGGAADFSVSTDVAACVYQGPAIASATGVGMVAVFTPTNFVSPQVMGSFGGPDGNFWFDGASGNIRSGNVIPYANILAYADGMPEWAYNLRTAADKTNATEATSNTVEGVLPSLTTIFVGGNNATLAFPGRYRSLLHALLILNDIPDEAGESLITDWAKSITPER